MVNQSSSRLASLLGVILCDLRAVFGRLAGARGRWRPSWTVSAVSWDRRRPVCTALLACARDRPVWWP
eukprot:4041908-Pyramimonas_sp.AAC.1